MKITIDNIEIFNTNEIYFHDQILVLFNYDPFCKKITLETEDMLHNNRTKIIFSEVEGFEMIGGESWGRGDFYRRIIDWIPIQGAEEQLLTKVKERYLTFCNDNTIENTFVKCFQSRFLFSCGNILDIVCKEIEIGAKDIVKQSNTYVYKHFRERERMTILRALRYKWSPDIVSNIKILFLDNVLPELYTNESMNPYAESTEKWSRCAKFIDQWKCNVRIECKINLHSSEMKNVIQSWLCFLTKDVVVNEFVAEFNDRKVSLNIQEIQKMRYET